MTLRMHEHVSLVRTEYGAVLLDERKGQYFQLNPTGCLVAQGVIDHSSPESIAASLAQEYDVSEEQARKDVTILIGRLREAGLVQP